VELNKIEFGKKKELGVSSVSRTTRS